MKAFFHDRARIVKRSAGYEERKRTGSVSGLMKLQWDCNLDLISKDKFYKVTVPFERGIESGVIFYNSVQNLEYAK